MKLGSTLRLICTGLLVLVGPYHALADPGPTNLNEASGVTPNHILASGGQGEYIDPGTGVLNLSVPIGPSFQVGPSVSYQLSLNYTSAMWGYDAGVDPPTPLLVRSGPFGAGFSLHMGRIVRVADPFAGVLGSNAWEYESPDGARHRIDLAGGNGPEMTVDGTYILSEEGGGDWTLRFPDGTVGEFGSQVYFNGLVYHRLERLWGPEKIDASDPPWITVTYDTGENAACIATVTDALGRQIVFTNANGRTTAIDMPTVNGAATYSFTYGGPFDLDAPDDPTNPNHWIGMDPVPGVYLLQEIRLPRADSPIDPNLDRTPVLEFRYYLDEAYPEANHGLLRERYLPMELHELVEGEPDPLTDPHYTYLYDYNEYQKPTWDGVFDRWSTGYFDALILVEKQLVNLDAVPPTWSWDRDHNPQGAPVEVRSLDPDGNCTRYSYHDDSPSGNEWMNGLPQATETYAGACGDEHEGVTRESWVYSVGHYDPVLGRIQDIEKRTISKTREGVVVITNRLALDDFGRPSDVITQGEGGLFRRVHTDWDTPDPESGDPWVLVAWTRRRVYDELGRPFSAEEASFSSTGRLLDHWSLVNPDGTPTPGKDVHTANVYDVDSSGYGWGLLLQTTTTGGDGGHPYIESFEYQANTYLARQRYEDSGDPYAELSSGWFSKNQDWDILTGLPLRVMDPSDEPPGSAGVPGHPGADENTFVLDTSYEWDDLGRPVRIHKAGVAPIEVSYPSLWEAVVRQCVSEPSDCQTIVLKYDRIGRPTEEWASDKNGNLNGRRTLYDRWSDRVSSRSEWFSCSPPSSSPCDPLTMSLDEVLFDYNRPDGAIDPLGRVWQVIASDGSVTSYSYNGREKTEEKDIDGEIALTRWVYDAFGRVIAVDAPIGADAAYRYDWGDRLVRAEIGEPGEIQARSFSYDALGRLRVATTPEGGTIRTLSYDARGKPLRSQDARGRQLERTYDDAGRLTELAEIRDDGGASIAITLMKIQYDGPDCGPGVPTCNKVIEAENFAEWLYQGSPVPIAKTTYSYEPNGGQLGGQATTYAAWGGRTNVYDSFDVPVVVAYAYDGWGQLQTIDYPNPFEGPASLNDVARIQYYRTNGWLDEVWDVQQGEQLLETNAFNAAGGPLRWTTGNQVVTEVLPDARFRPSQITVTSSGGSVGDLWDSGDYSYDGAGNVVAVGGDTFGYDLVGRLRHAEVSFDGVTWTEDYAYDSFGNLLAKSQSNTAPDPSTVINMEVDPRTNRILETDGYKLEWDPAGNLIRDPSVFAGDEEGGLVFDGQGRLSGIARQAVEGPNPSQREPVGPGIWSELFAYDEKGRRMMRVDETTGLTTFYVRDLAGRVLSEFVKPAAEDLGVQWKRDMVYALGQTISVIEADTPDPPGALKPSVTASGSDYTVALSWKENASGNEVTRYRIYLWNAGNQTWEQVGETPDGTTTNWEAPTPVPAGTYYYRVHAVQGAAPETEGPPSRTVRVDPGGGDPDVGIEHLVASTVDGLVRLDWDRVPLDGPIGILSDFYDYRVERQLSGTSNWEELNSLPLRDPFFTDPAPLDGETLYRVTVVDTSGGEGPSGTFVITPTTDPFRPVAPGGLMASSGPRELEISLRWDEVPEADIVWYRVYRMDGSSPVLQEVLYFDPAIAPPEDPWVEVTNVPASTQLAKVSVSPAEESDWFSLAVVAVDAAGRESEYSATVHVQPALAEATLAKPIMLEDLSRWETSQSVGATALGFFYRREEGTRGLFERRNTFPSQAFVDVNLDPCKAYVYMSTAVQYTTIDGAAIPTGQESGVSESLWVPRYLEPDAPVLAPGQIGVETKLKWGGLTTCDPASTDFTIVGFQVWRRSYEETYLGSVMVDPQDPDKDELSELEFIYNPAYPTYPYLYYLKPIYLDNVDGPDDDNLYGPGGPRICASTYGLLDMSECNYPASPPGGGGDVPFVEEPLRPRMQKIHDPRASLEAPIGPSVGNLLFAQNIASVVKRKQEVLPNAGVSTPHVPGSRSFPWEELPYRAVGTGGEAGSPATRGRRITYLHSDHLGTTRVGTDANGQMLYKVASLPFGELLEEATGSGLTEYALHARERASFTYMLGRYYSPGIARFVSVDPGSMARLVVGKDKPRKAVQALLSQIGFWPDYIYAFGNPVRFVDRNGASPLDAIQQALAVVNDVEWDLVGQYGYRSTVEAITAAATVYGIASFVAAPVPGSRAAAILFGAFGAWQTYLANAEVIESATDITSCVRIRSLLHQAEAAAYTDPEKSLELLKQARSIAKNMNDRASREKIVAAIESAILEAERRIFPFDRKQGPDPAATNGRCPDPRQPFTPHPRGWQARL